MAPQFNCMNFLFEERHQKLMPAADLVKFQNTRTRSFRTELINNTTKRSTSSNMRSLKRDLVAKITFQF